MSVYPPIDPSSPEYLALCEKLGGEVMFRPNEWTLWQTPVRLYRLGGECFIETGEPEHGHILHTYDDGRRIDLQRVEVQR